MTQNRVVRWCACAAILLLAGCLEIGDMLMGFPAATSNGDGGSQSADGADQPANDNGGTEDLEDQIGPTAPSSDGDADNSADDDSTDDDLVDDDSADDDLTDETGVPPLPEGAELTVTDSGLEFFDLDVGIGEQPTLSSNVVVDYTGYLEDGTIFDDGAGVQFNLGAVVEGFAEGISTMQVGGRRRLIIPPELGYGLAGNAGAGIGGDDTIIFDVTLISIE